MGNELSWPTQRTQLLTALSDARPSPDFAAEAVGATVDALRRWRAVGPCPDSDLNRHVDLICGRFGYLCLTGVTVESGADPGQGAALNEHFRKLILDLVAIVTEVEQSEVDRHADAVESP